MIPLWIKGVKATNKARLFLNETIGREVYAHAIDDKPGWRQEKAPLICAFCMTPVVSQRTTVGRAPRGALFRLAQDQKHEAICARAAMRQRTSKVLVNRLSDGRGSGYEWPPVCRSFGLPPTRSATARRRTGDGLTEHASCPRVSRVYSGGGRHNPRNFAVQTLR